jgi:tetratricopeptide (TPR) repeat protein
MEQVQKDHSTALQTKEMIGRKAQLEQVMDIVKNSSKGLNIFFCTGSGGIGKTRFLNQVGKQVNRLADEGLRILWSDIVDLYHSEVHSNSKIEDMLIERLDKKGEFFEAYRQERNNFENQRRNGLPGPSLERARMKLTEAFVSDYQRLTQVYRVILTFDTLEQVQYEDNVVNHLCEVENAGASVQQWFFNQIPQFLNTVVLFAGRKKKGLQEDFYHYFASKNAPYQELTIPSFKRDEAREYLLELSKSNPDLKKALANDVFERIYVGADNGRPIYMSLASDLFVSFGQDIGGLFPSGNEPIAGDYLEKMREKIARRLLELPEAEGIIIHYLSYLRQGLSGRLLYELIDGEWSDVEIEDALVKMSKYTFIKTHPDEPSRIYLHDEIYDLLDQYYVNEVAEAAETFEKIRKYYAQVRQDILEKNDPLKRRINLATGWAKDERFALQDATVRQLYYEMQVSPREGFHRNYARWAEEAINSNQIGYDMRLRDVVLSFFDHLKKEEENSTSTSRKRVLAQQIDLDCINRNNALRWVRRYLMRGEFKKAERVARRLRNSQEPGFIWSEVDDIFYKAGLLAAWGWALIFVKDKTRDEILAILHEAVGFLEPKPEYLSEELDEPWRWAKTLGWAYNNIGYLYRNFNQFSMAIRPYGRAISLYRQVDIRDEMAITLNNLSYVWAELGAIDQAMALVLDAQLLREQLGQEYSFAYSLNTRGAIHNKANQPHRALPLSQKAYDIFSSVPTGSKEEFGHPRGSALASVSIGEAHRLLAKLVDLQVYGYREALAHLEEGRNALRRAIGILAEAKGDIYLLKATAELGRLYRDWSRLDLRRGDKNAAIEHKDLAIHQLEKALTIAVDTELDDDDADILHDLARLYWIHDDMDQVKKYAKKVDAHIPDEYKPQLGKGLVDVPEPANSYWLTMGKLYLLQADMTFDPETAVQKLNDEQEENMFEALTYNLLAVACFEKYSSHKGNAGMRITRAVIYDSLKRYATPRLQRVLQKIEEVSDTYCVNLDSIREYLEQTLGVYTVWWE